MSVRNLLAEFEAAVTRLHDDGHVRRVLSLGVPRAAIFGIRPLVGVAAVETNADGWFQFIEAGELALVIADGVPGPIGWETIDEVIAIRTSTPGKWWRATGAAPVLGAGRNADMIDYAMVVKEPITLHATPPDWLRAGGTGLCIVNWDAPLSATFDGLPVASDPATARRLRKKITDEALATLDIRKAHHALAA